MYVAQITFASTMRPSKTIEASDAIARFLGVLRSNGQVCGREWPISEGPQGYVATVLIPERTSLALKHSNAYVAAALRHLEEVGLGEPAFAASRHVDGEGTCRCKQHGCYVLYTYDVLLEPPLRCGECFRTVPLYRIPPTEAATPSVDYENIISWQSAYQSCDTLHMLSWTLEQAATRQMSRFDSTLSRQGLEICARIYELTTVPTYYYLYSYYGRSRKQEQKRRCPSCSNEWLLAEPWHKFDFKCDHCRLVSNIALDVK